MVVKRTVVDYGRALNNIIKRINKENLSLENKQILTELYQYLFVKGISEIRIVRIINSLLIIAREYDLTKLNEQEVIRIIYNLKIGKYKDETIKTYFVSLKHLFKYQHRTLNIDIHFRREYKTDYLSFNDITNILKLIDNDDYRIFTMFLYDTACRPSEAFSITLSDIKEYEKYIEFKVIGKTGERIIYSTIFQKYIKQYIKKQKEQHNKFLFNISYDYYTRKLLKKIQKILGLNKLYPYLFRHSRITDLANSLTEQQMKKLFGWSPSSSMLDYYIKKEGVKIPIQKLSSTF